MKILAFTDTHVRKDSWKVVLKKVKDADILIGGGDFSDWGQDSEKVVSKFKNIGKPFLILHGNHEDEELMRDIEKKFDNVIFLHKKSYELGDYVFFGYGGGGFAKNNKDFEKVAKKFIKSVKKEKTVIIISHGPPYGTKLDKLEGLGYTGCKSLRKFIDEHHPVLWICGHIHENFGELQVVGKTVVANPGPEGKFMEV